MDQEIILAGKRVNERRSAVGGDSEIADGRGGSFDTNFDLKPSLPNHRNILETLNANMDLLESILGRLHFLVSEIGETVP